MNLSRPPACPLKASSGFRPRTRPRLTTCNTSPACCGRARNLPQLTARVVSPPLWIPQPVSRPLRARLCAENTRSRPMIEGLTVTKRRPRALPVGSAPKKIASRDSRNRLGNPQAPSQASRVRPCAADTRSRPWSEGLPVAKRRPHHSPVGSAPKKTPERASGKAMTYQRSMK